MKWTDRPLKSRLRIIGAVVLLLGTTATVALGLRGARSVDLSQDPVMARYYAQEERQAQILYGNLGLLANDAWRSLKRPRTQAILLGALSTLAACGCFFFARLLDTGSGQEDPSAGVSPAPFSAASLSITGEKVRTDHGASRR
jgi:hypothetical protein